MWVKSNLLCAKSNLLSANLFFNLLIYKDLRAVFFTHRVSKRLKDIYSPFASAPGECSIKINKQLGACRCAGAQPTHQVNNAECKLQRNYQRTDY